MAMIKESLISFLKILEKAYKQRIDFSYDEKDSEQWLKFLNEIKQQRLTIQKGGIK